jgi:hypothetical protein
MEEADRQPASEPLAKQHGWDVGDHHPQRRTGDHRDERLVLRGEGGGRDLGLVAHLGEKACDQRRTEHPEPGEGRVRFVEFVGDQGPERHRDKGDPEHPLQGVRVHKCSEPGADGAGKGVIGECRDEDAQDDGRRLPKFRGEDEGEELGVVADFGEGDDAGRDEEGFHGSSRAGPNR